MASDLLCKQGVVGSNPIVSTPKAQVRRPALLADQLDDLVEVADLAGHVDTRTTEGYRHQVRASLPHAIEAWNGLLDRAG